MTSDAPLTVGQTLEQLLRKEGLNQTEAALKIGITRQYLNSVINGKLPLTTELQWKIEPVVRKGLDFWESVKRDYDKYLTTSEGRRKHVEAREEELATRWDLLGPRKLVNYEIELAIEAGVVAIETTRGDTEMSSFDKNRLTSLTYVLSMGAAAELFATDGTRKLVKALPYLELAPGETLRGVTLETVRLGGRFAGFVHGLAEPLVDKMLELRGNRIIKPWNAVRVPYRVVNEGHTPIRLQQGEPFLEVIFEYLSAEPLRPEPSESSDAPT
ncbi:MAG: helix-turn-helix domain-containing protein [Verrucomicrobiaceae bacterium]|nr:helix-turn-helix domain-containing protein [Verrucomicrobiaceae bacterium]